MQATPFADEGYGVYPMDSDRVNLTQRIAEQRGKQNAGQKICPAFAMDNGLHNRSGNASIQGRVDLGLVTSEPGENGIYLGLNSRWKRSARQSVSKLLADTVNQRLDAVETGRFVCKLQQVRHQE